MSDKTFKIATFNINSVRLRLEALIEWMIYADPDVVCLQETKVQDADFPADDLLDAGYHVIYSGMKSYNGVAIVSKAEPQNVAIGFDDGEGEESDAARLISAEYDFGDGVALPIVNTYVPQGREVGTDYYAYKLRWFERLKALFARRWSPDAPLLWCGDLNVALEDIDVYSPKTILGSVCFNPEVGDALRDVMAWGLTDVFRQHHPEPEQYTFWDYRLAQSVERNRGWRIDYLMATRALAGRAVDAWVDKAPREGVKPSDHTPLIGEFRLGD